MALVPQRLPPHRRDLGRPPTHNNDRNRSALLADFVPMANVPGIALLALQKGPRTGRPAAYYGRRR